MHHFRGFDPQARIFFFLKSDIKLAFSYILDSCNKPRRSGQPQNLEICTINEQNCNLFRVSGIYIVDIVDIVDIVENILQKSQCADIRTWDK